MSPLTLLIFERYVPKGDASMKKVLNQIFSVSAALLLAGTSAWSFTNGQNAGGVLGQTRDDGSATFTKKLKYNGRPTGINTPYGVAVDAVGHRLFVADSLSRRVLVYNLSTANALLDNGPDAVLGQPDFDTYGGSPSKSIGLPTGIAVDGAQRLFVSDNVYNRVLVYDVSTVTNGQSAVHVLGQPDFNASNFHRTQSGFFGPMGLALDSGGQRLYVADAANNRVMVFDVAAVSDGENAVNVLGQSDFTAFASGAGASGFSNPLGVAVDAAQRLFVADNFNNRVLVFDVAAIGNGENAVNVLGQPNFVSTGPVVDQAHVYSPTGVLRDGGGRLFVSDGYRVTVFDVAAIADGELAVNELGQADFNSQSAATGQGTLDGPRGLGLVGTQTLYVADADNSRVMVFDVDSITDGEDALNALGQTTPDGAVDFTKNLRWDGRYTGMSTPAGLAVDPVGHRLFVADLDSARVLVYNLSPANGLLDAVPDRVLGKPNLRDVGFTVPSAATLSTPQGLALDSRQRLFVADSSYNRVLVFDVSEVTNGENAVRVLGQSNFTTIAPASTAAGFNNPQGVVLDGDDRLYVSEYSNHRVLAFDVGAITNGQSAVHVIGQSNFTSAVAATTQAGLNNPRGMAVDGAHRLFVADSLNHRVMVFDVSAIVDGEDAVNVLGQPDFTSSGIHYTVDGMYDVGGVSWDGGDRIFVTDIGIHRLLSYDVSSLSDGEDAVNVMGQPDFETAGRNIDAAGMDSPRAVTYFDKKMFVADAGNSRLLVFGESAVAGVDTLRAYPNPFRSARGHRFVVIDQLPPLAALTVYSLSGQPVRGLTADAFGEVVWDATNDSGQPAPSGVYLLLAQGDGGVKTVKIVIQR